ncbi:Methyl-accepting chemotaxis protein [uncultured delta proteobacterium]|uniref:Methyl-accepting chemotaxis protein n=1 Tax=uncultured delta proteobacterium TaxID=34034 RepID=A0A212JKE6_9DELT|nr:Methyl-accepting chemotaxis protein [uncultured delta proteobacterium]
MFWNNLGLSKKMSVFTGAMLLCIFALVCLFMATIDLLSNESHRVERAGELNQLMAEREIDHLNWISSLQQYVFDPTQKTLSVQTDGHKCGLGGWYYGQGRKDAEAFFPGVAKLLAALEDPHLALHGSAAEIITHKEAGQLDAARRVFTEVSVPSVQGVQKILKEISSMMNAEQKASALSFSSSVTSSRNLTLGLVGLAFVVALGLGILIARTVTAPTVRLAQFADKVAEGDLKATIVMARTDEIGSLATNLQRMIENINAMIRTAEEKTAEAEHQSEVAREAVLKAEEALRTAELAKQEGMYAAASQLEEVINVISLASEKLVAQIAQSERGSGEQELRVGEAATAMEEMTSTVMEVARSAGVASTSSSQTKEKAEEGAVVVRQAVASIQSVQTASLAMKEDVAVLANQAEAITGIMNVISDIADQTNLLALNAAIEAARAGDAGRGFAVVADEVRKLAEKTMVSTANVGESISGIQKSVNASIGQVEKAVTLIEDATLQVNKSGDMLTEIVGLADGTASQIQAIAAASEQQSATCEEINRSVADVNAIAGQTAAAMRDANLAVSDLADQARNLNALVADMKSN